MESNCSYLTVNRGHTPEQLTLLLPEETHQLWSPDLKLLRSLRSQKPGSRPAARTGCLSASSAYIADWAAPALYDLAQSEYFLVLKC